MRPYSSPFSIQNSQFKIRAGVRPPVRPCLLKRDGGAGFVGVGAAEHVDGFGDAFEREREHREDAVHEADGGGAPDAFVLGVEPDGIGHFFADAFEPFEAGHGVDVAPGGGDAGLDQLVGVHVGIADDDDGPAFVHLCEHVFGARAAPSADIFEELFVDAVVEEVAFKLFKVARLVCGAEELFRQFCVGVHGAAHVHEQQEFDAVFTRGGEHELDVAVVRALASMVSSMLSSSRAESLESLRRRKRAVPIWRVSSVRSERRFLNRRSPATATALRPPPDPPTRMPAGLCPPCPTGEVPPVPIQWFPPSWRSFCSRNRFSNSSRSVSQSICWIYAICSSLSMGGSLAFCSHCMSSSGTSKWSSTTWDEHTSELQS